MSSGLSAKTVDLLQLADELEAFSKQQIKSGALSPVEGPLDLILVYFLSRAHRTFSSGLVLCQHGYGVESAMQVRSLAEDLITLRTLISKPDMVTRFIEFDAVHKKNTLEALRPLGEAFAEVRQRWLDAEEKIEADFQGFRQKYTESFDRYKWAGRDMTARRLASDADSEELYEVFFAQTSSVLHGSPEASKRYVQIEANGTPSFLMRSRDQDTQNHLQLLVTVFPLFWDELSMVKGAPSRHELLVVCSNSWFEYFSRRSEEYG